MRDCACSTSATPFSRKNHAPTPTVRALADAVVAGAHDDAIEGVEVVVRPALEASAGDVLAADGFLLGTPANFGYMSGALKHFFDTIFLEAGGAPRRRRLRRGDRRRRGSPSGCGCTVATTPPGRCGRCESIVQALGWRQARRGARPSLGDVGDGRAGGGLRARRHARGPPRRLTAEPPRDPRRRGLRPVRSWDARPLARSTRLLVVLTLGGPGRSRAAARARTPARTSTPGRWTPCARPSSAPAAC